MQLYVIGGLLLAVLAFIVWFAIRERKAGAVSEVAKVATKTVEVQQAQDRAGAEAAAEDVTDRLRKGGF